jgi:cation:H+ antiporter
MIFTEVLWFLGSALVVVAAGIGLSHTADTIAERTGFGGLAVGVVLLAGATTLPEIITSVSAIRLDAPDLAVGGVLGSCPMNLLILALLDLLYHRRHGQGVIRSVLVGHTRAATLSIVMLSVAGVFIASQLPPAVFGIGLGTIILAALYLSGLRVATQTGEAQAVAPPTLPSATSGALSLRTAVIGFAIATALLTLSGPRLASSAEAIAEATNLGASFVGTIFLALVTSLPELVASLAALRLGAADMAVGNIFGSNAFNVAVLFICDIAYRKGPLLAAVNPVHVVTALVTIVLTGIAMQSILAREQRRVWVLEPDAIAMFVAFVVGAAIIYAVR